MRTWWIAIVAVAVAVASSASGDGKKKRPAHKSTKTAATKGFYKILVKPNAKWVMTETIDVDESGKKAPPRTVTVETYDVRKVGDADVARLRWTLIERDGSKQDIGSSDGGKYTQLAVTPAGLYILTAEMDDAKIAERLKDKPSRSDPPKPYAGTKQNNGRYLTVSERLVCFGEGPLPDAGDCPDTCDASTCVSATDGIVKLFGNWAPGVSAFAAKGYDDVW